MKPVAVLPLHVWDRELDSRLHIAYILLQNGYEVLVGHEYTIAALYNIGLPLFHFGAGRPVQNHPRSTSWYPNILSAGGFVGLCYEEGINDLASGAESHFAGISHSSVVNVSKLYGWSEGEMKLASSICPSISTSQLLQSKYDLLFNTRLELLTSSLGRTYYSRKANSINELFGDYVLISDNFGLEAYGTKKPLNQESNIKQFDISEERKKDLLHDAALSAEKIAVVRNKFAISIRHLAKQLPDHNFLLRPHPVADPRFWHEALSGLRNVTVLYKDSCEPWLFSASAIVHSGCTLGIQSYFTRTPTIDISALIDDYRNGASSKLATVKASSMDDLISAVKSSFCEHRSTNLPTAVSSKELEMSTFFDLNVQASGVNEFNLKFENNLQLSRKSMILGLNADSITASRSALDSWRRFSRDRFYDCLNSLPPLPPNPNKSRFFSVSEIKSKMYDVTCSHSYRKKMMKIVVHKLRAPNVFLISSM